MSNVDATKFKNTESWMSKIILLIELICLKTTKRNIINNKSIERKKVFAMVIGICGGSKGNISDIFILSY